MTDTILSQALDIDGDGQNGYTSVQSIAAAALTLPFANIVQIRFTFQGGATEAYTITNAYVGHAADSGDAYDFLATPVQILFGGSGSGVAPAGSTIVSDWATFAYDKTSALLLAFYGAGGATSDCFRRKTGLGANFNQYAKLGSDAATVNKTGYGTNAGYLVLMNKIEVQTSIGGFFSFF